MAAQRRREAKATAPDFSSPDQQEQSMLFSKLPLDVRRLIYFQYWLGQGITQHIYSFGPGCHIAHYPCLLETEAFHHHQPPVPATSGSTTPGPQEGDEAPEGEQGIQQPQDGQQPDGSDDDPGDVNGAIQAIAGPHPHIPLQLPDSVNHLELWRASPWCIHERCFRKFMASYNDYYGEAYKRHCEEIQYPLAREQSILIKPLIVCKAMCLEALVSMYTMLRFSFGSQISLMSFAKRIPRALTQKIQLIDIVLYSDPLDDGNLPELCQTLGESFPGVQELRMSLHIPRFEATEPLPDRAHLEPLYALARKLNQPRKFELKLPIQGRKSASIPPYGETDYLGDAPFNVALVPKGWHVLADCVGFEV